MRTETVTGLPPVGERVQRALDELHTLRASALLWERAADELCRTCPGILEAMEGAVLALSERAHSVAKAVRMGCPDSAEGELALRRNLEIAAVAARIYARRHGT